MTRCKFRCQSVTQNADGTWSYAFAPVTGGSAENEQFFKWTPWGECKFGVTAERMFEAGKTYYVDFTPEE